MKSLYEKIHVATTMAVFIKSTKALLFQADGVVEEVTMGTNQKSPGLLLEQFYSHIGCEFVEWQIVREWYKGVQTFETGDSDDTEGKVVLRVSLVFNENPIGQTNPFCPHLHGNVLLYVSGTMEEDEEVIDYREICGDIENVKQLMSKVSSLGLLNRQRIMQFNTKWGGKVVRKEDIEADQELDDAVSDVRNFFDEAQAAIILDKLAFKLKCRMNWEKRGSDMAFEILMAMAENGNLLPDLSNCLT